MVTSVYFFFILKYVLVSKYIKMLYLYPCLCCLCSMCNIHKNISFDVQKILIKFLIIWKFPFHFHSFSRKLVASFVCYKRQHNLKFSFFFCFKNLQRWKWNENRTKNIEQMSRKFSWKKWKVSMFCVDLKFKFVE